MKTSIFIALFMVLASSTAPMAQQYKAWSVFRNCTVYPCVIGVAVSDWTQPGWSRIASFQNEVFAWQHACALHYEGAHNSPDIAQGR